MTTVSWLGRGGTVDAPRSGDSSDAGNWSLGSIPNNQHSIDFAPGHYTVVDTIDNWNVQSVNIGVGVTFVAEQDLTIAGAYGVVGQSTLAGTLKMRGATLFTGRDVAGAGTISGFGTISEGLLGDHAGVSSINLRASGGTLTVDVSSAEALLSGQLSGSGTIALTGSGYGQAILDMAIVTVATLRIDGGEHMSVGIGRSLVDRGRFELKGGQVFTSGSPLVLAGATTLSGGGIYAYGRRPTGTLALRSDTTIADQFNIDNILAPHNGGTVTQSGTLMIHAALANEGPPAHIVNMRSGTWNLVDGGSMLTDACIGTLHNHGVLEKTGSGTSSLALTVENTGTIEASSGVLDFQADVTGSGAIEVSGGASLHVEAGVAATQALTFAGAGALLIDDAQRFAAAVAGFGASDTIDFAGLGASGATLAYTYASPSDHAHGTLRVVSGLTSAAFSLDGHYTASGFHLAADSAGTGTIVTYVAHQPASA